MNENVKKVFILVLCGVIIFAAGVFAGRQDRLSKLTTASAGIEYEGDAIIDTTISLSNELKQRVSETEHIEREIERITTGIDECVGVAAGIREGLAVLSGNTSSSSAVVREIAKRIGEYEKRIAQLENSLKQLKTGSDVE